jgi:hypothetical protein
MHRKYAAQGLTAVSVSVDLGIEDVQEKRVAKSELHAAALKFLQKQNATFPNLLLDEPDEVWQKKLGEPLVPLVFVFNRQGQWKKFGPDTEPGEVEKQVEEWLKTN